MSTFTLQDLNLPMTADEAIKAVDQAQQIEAIKAVDQAQQIEAIKALEQHAPEPQHSWTKVEMGEVLPKSQLDPMKIIEEMMAQFSIKLQLLATVIGEQARGNSQAEDQSLQDCVALTLQQAEWFQKMVNERVDGFDFESYAHDSVKDCVESEVDSYFQNSFDPEYHFDFGDAVENAVDDRLEDIVREKIDEVVAEQLEELVAEKLKNLRVVFE